MDLRCSHPDLTFLGKSSKLANHISTAMNNPAGRIMNFENIFGARCGQIYCTIYGTTNLSIQQYGGSLRPHPQQWGVAMAATSPSRIMEAAFGRLHNSRAGAFVEFIILDGESAGKP